ncbi:MAG TPA: neutral zinc metallopeptidase [Candidatus Sulfotelmatobacter sp.]
MRWTPGGSQDDVEDDRASSGGFGGIHLGIGGVILVAILSLVFHRNFFALLSSGGSSQPSSSISERQPGQAGQNDPEKPLVEFVTFVLNDAQATWTKILSTQGVPYRHAKLVLFRNSINSACGLAESATGPFYCPEDEKVYIDLGFYRELKDRFGAPGEFAEAYVLAHEIGHHVQKLLGIEGKVHAAQMNHSQAKGALSQKLELQADCFAGVWGHSTEQRDLLDPNDLEAALNAAAAIGDDRLQKIATGHVNPDTFTHGTSAERVEWFKRGFNDGTIAACNTFQ